MRYPALLFATLIVFGCNTQKQNGWLPLFNGENLDGWTIKCKPEDKAKNFWSVKNGYIEVNSIGHPEHDYVWLMTEKEYKDFSLKLKFAAFRSSPGNSGVQIRSRYDEKEGWLDGPQIDIHPQEPWRSGMMWDETRDVKRWIYPDIPNGKWVDKSMRTEVADLYFSDEELQWNEIEITAKRWSVKAFLNGTQITDFNNIELLTGPGHLQYHVGEKGFICLQLHIGDELKMLYKDILIKEL